MSLDNLLEENKPLAPFTTLGIGGPARWFVEATREDEVAEAAAWAREQRRASCLCSAGEATWWFPTADSTGWCCTWLCAGSRRRTR